MTLKSSVALAVSLSLAGILSGCGETATVENAAGGRLSLSSPSAVTIHRGKTATVEIRIQRTDAPGEVAVLFGRLPKGVDVVDSSTRITGDRGTYTLRASDTADLLKNQSCDVTATGKSGSGVTQSFTISVEE